MKFSQREPVSRWMQGVVALFLAMLALPAWAYLDPGTGSMIISAIVGLFATIGLAVKTYWYKIKAFMRKDGAESAVRDEAEIDSESSADH
ncbi:MAG: hypothetical protein QGH93_07300 [Gammaproteobacteria bacterium]|jgi:hypothetical protein|nr:hypothetical protein [Gammaproteobacteria bacterium]